MRVLLILKQSITQAGHAPLVALHVILQVMAGNESFSTGRKGAGKWPLVGVGSRVLLQVALCCEKTRTTRLTTVECVSWGENIVKECQTCCSIIVDWVIICLSKMPHTVCGQR